MANISREFLSCLAQPHNWRVMKKFTESPPRDLTSCSAGQVWWQQMIVHIKSGLGKHLYVHKWEIGLNYPGIMSFEGLSREDLLNVLYRIGCMLMKELLPMHAAVGILAIYLLRWGTWITRKMVLMFPQGLINKDIILTWIWSCWL